MKKNFVKALCLMLALIMSVATLSACGGKQSANDIKGYGAWKGGIVFEIDEEAVKDYNFRVSAYRDFRADPVNRYYADGADEFLKQYPEATVEFLSIGDHQPDAIAAAIAAGDVWDVQYVFTCSQMPGDIVDGLYETIDGYFDLNDERINKGTISGAYFDGHYYGVSNEVMQECVYLSYNETVFKENGLKTPHEYYAEGEWTFDTLYKICGELYEKGLTASFGNFIHPVWILKHATKWNEDYTDVEITIDSAEARRYFDKLRTMVYDWDMTSNDKNINVANRACALSTQTVPNLTTWNNTTETEDLIRYIFLPGITEEEEKPYINIADANFMVPSGANQDMKAASVELAIQMGMGRKNHLVNYYKEVMVEEDYNLLMESMKNEKPLSRAFSPNFRYSQFNFSGDMKNGKPVSTYVSEYKGVLESHAETFRTKLAEYREYTGLSNED